MYLLFMTLACTKTKRFDITIPAEINIDQEIKVLAPVNRENSEESDKAINELIRNMSDARNPRFALIDQKRSQSAYTSSNVESGTVLTRAETEKICKRSEATGILSLEKFRYDKDWNFSTYQTTKERRRTITEDGKEREQVITEDVTMHRASLSVDMNSDWKVYACDGEIIDNNRKVSSKDLSAEGESRSDAKSSIGETDDIIDEMAKNIGMQYFRRVSPYEISVQRKYYPSGHAKIKAGNEALDEGNYAGAESLFRQASEESTKKNKGKALYNLAMVLEIMNRINESLEAALDANRYLKNDMSQTYVDVLRKRKKDLDELKKQLGQ